jgi:hypothetical protein
MSPESILVWNVRGLNGWLHRDTQRELVAVGWPSIVCVQETKLPVISNFDVIQCLGPGFDFFFVPAVQTRGGILPAWCSNTWSASHTSSHSSVSVRLQPVDGGGTHWWFTGVYGPSTDNLKHAFLEELREIAKYAPGNGSSRAISI